MFTSPGMRPEGTRHLPLQAGHFISFAKEGLKIFFGLKDHYVDVRKARARGPGFSLHSHAKEGHPGEESSALTMVTCAHRVSTCTFAVYSLE